MEENKRPNINLGKKSGEVSGGLEDKKNPKVDLKRQSGLFYGIGMIISISLMLMAFEFNVMQSLSADSLSLKKAVEEEDKPIETPPPTDQPPPPPPQAIQAPEIKEVPDEKKVEKFIEETKETPTKQVEVTKAAEETSTKAPEVKVEVEDDNKIFNPHELQEQAEFMGGQKEFYKFLAENIKYPKMARRQGIEGTVYLEFVIEKDGLLTDVKVKKPIANDGGCNDEAVRVLKTSPKWKAAKQRGKNVRQKMVIPVKFKLG
ncbi:MAG: energy transducer TonB [Bacteroidetes bacterium]|nr:MAG: energy transducer TonB [Bacteroidota bacterium]TAG86844.1 MAG: energy transducer TonB [Bacteroidota bacterium]